MSEARTPRNWWILFVVLWLLFFPRIYGGARDSSCEILLRRSRKLQFPRFVNEDTTTTTEWLHMRTSEMSKRPTKTSAQGQEPVSVEQFNEGIESVKAILKTLNESLEAKVKGVQDYVDIQIQQVVSRIDSQDVKIESATAMAGNNTPPLEDMARCLVVSGLFMEPGEDIHILQAKIEQLLEAMSCSHCLVAQFKRMGQGQHPLVKVAMANQKHKAEVLQKKRLLAQAGPAYNRVYIRPSMSTSERRSDKQMRLLANYMGVGFRNGQLMPRQRWNQAQTGNPMTAQGNMNQAQTGNLMSAQGQSRPHEIPPSHMQSYSQPTIPSHVTHTVERTPMNMSDSYIAK